MLTNMLSKTVTANFSQQVFYGGKPKPIDYADMESYQQALGDYERSRTKQADPNKMRRALRKTLTAGTNSSAFQGKAHLSGNI